MPGKDSKSYPRRSKTGVYDTQILCADCDRLLGVFDQHAVEKLLRGKFICRRDDRVDVHVHDYPDADPDILRKFVASVAWRASLTTDEMFKTVRLGPYADAILDLLKGNAPSKPIEVLIAEFEPSIGGFLNPHRTRFSGVRFLVLYAARFVFYLKTDQQPAPAELAAAQLTTGQPVRLIIRQFDNSKEAAIMRGMLDNPRFASTRARWDAARK
ncbi:MAG: hypothetical protein ACYC0C_17280 [Devosia sp.]